MLMGDVLEVAPAVTGGADFEISEKKLEPSGEITLAETGDTTQVENEMGKASCKAPAPLLKYRYQIKSLYLIMLVHGIGVLLPWNMFINARDYFVDYKLGYNYTGSHSNFAVYFVQSLGIASQLPCAICNWINIFFHCENGLMWRITLSLLGEMICFLITIVLVTVNTSRHPGLFFGLTMALVVIINVAGGIYQNCIYGIGAKVDHTSTLLLGSNISGTFVSIVNILSISIAPSAENAAICYFLTALIIICLCLATYFALYCIPDYRSILEKTNEQEDATKRKGRPPYFTILRKCWPQCLNVCLVFGVTLTVYPAVLAEVKATNRDFFLPEKYFSSVMCFLTFNLFAVLGNLLFEKFKWPGSDRVWILVLLRLLFIPFFLYCNYQPSGIARFYMPIFEDWMFWLGSVALGLSSGYFSSLAMHYCQRSVDSTEHATTAGMLGSASIVTGVLIGICCSFGMIHLAGQQADSSS